MNDKCVFCGSEDYGSGCSYSPDGAHYHPMSFQRCRYCGSENRGGECYLNPTSKQHIYGIGHGVCVLCEFPHNCQDPECPVGEHGKHDLLGPDFTGQFRPATSTVRLLTDAGRFEEALTLIQNLPEENRHEALLNIASGLVMHAETPRDHSHTPEMMLRAVEILGKVPPELYKESCEYVAESVAKKGNVENALAFCFKIPDSNTIPFVADLLDDYVVKELDRSLRPPRDFERAKKLAYCRLDNVSMMSKVADEMARSGEIAMCLELIEEMTGRNDFTDLECGSAWWLIALHYWKQGNQSEAEKYFHKAEQGLEIRTKYSSSRYDRIWLRHALRAIREGRMDEARDHILDIEDPEVLKKLVRVANALAKSPFPESSIIVALVHQKLADRKAMKIKGLASKLAICGKVAEANRLFYTTLNYISSSHRRMSGSDRKKDPEELLEMARALDACGFTEKAGIFRNRASAADLNNRPSSSHRAS